MLFELKQIQSEFFQVLTKKGRSHNTIKNYRTDIECFNKFLASQNKNYDIKNFTLKETNLYGRYLEEKYPSDNSRRRRLQALRMFFDFLVEKEVLDTNPVREIPTSPKFLDIPRPTPFIDIKLLWTHLISLKGKTPIEKLLIKRNQLVTLLIFGSGLKVSELAKLKTSHIMEGKDGVRVMVIHDKRDPYTIPLPEIFNTIYTDYIELLEVQKAKSNHTFDELLFNANPYKILSGGLSPRGVEIVLKELREKLEIILTPKSLRQACIFKWLTMKLPDSQIKEWLGVAPSYSLGIYREHLENNLYGETFLKELYEHYKV
jgi:site-specific recombinase XerD